jgi:hypothetical protein
VSISLLLVRLITRVEVKAVGRPKVFRCAQRCACFGIKAHGGYSTSTRPCSFIRMAEEW